MLAGEPIDKILIVENGQMQVQTILEGNEFIIEKLEQRAIVNS